MMATRGSTELLQTVELCLRLSEIGGEAAIVLHSANATIYGSR